MATASIIFFFRDAETNELLNNVDIFVKEHWKDDIFRYIGNTASETSWTYSYDMIHAGQKVSFKFKRTKYHTSERTFTLVTWDRTETIAFGRIKADVKQKGFLDWLADGIKGFWTGVTDAFSDAVDTALDWVGKVADILKVLSAEFWQGLENLRQAVKNIIEEVLLAYAVAEAYILFKIAEPVMKKIFRELDSIDKMSDEEQEQIINEVEASIT